MNIIKKLQKHMFYMKLMTKNANNLILIWMFYHLTLSILATKAWKYQNPKTPVFLAASLILYIKSNFLFFKFLNCYFF